MFRESKHRPHYLEIGLHQNKNIIIILKVFFGGKQKIFDIIQISQHFLFSVSCKVLFRCWPSGAPVFQEGSCLMIEVSGRF